MRKLITIGAACALIAAAGFAAATIMSGAGIASIFQTTGTTGTVRTVTVTTATTATTATTTTVVTPPAPPPRRVTICHRTKSKTNPWTTITVSQGAVAAHRRHGDHLGRCTGNEPVTVCHKSPKTKKWSKLKIKAKALRAHKRHGDTVGTCTAKQVKKNKGKKK